MTCACRDKTGVLLYWTSFYPGSLEADGPAGRDQADDAVGSGELDKCDKIDVGTRGQGKSTSGSWYECVVQDLKENSNLRVKWVYDGSESDLEREEPFSNPRAMVLLDLNQT